jgi:3-hydroxybutyryl-CoA dehydratase
MSQWRRYDDLEVGQCFPDSPALYVVTADAVAELRAIATETLVDAIGPVAEAADDIAPPMLAAVYMRGAQAGLRGPPGGIHAKQHFSFRHPVRVGDRLGTTLTIKEKYERKGRRYVVGETTTRNDSGDVVTVGAITFIWGQET